jgi:predicted ABC-class ATPase
VADRVIAMQDYRPHDVTERARAIAAEPTGRVGEGGEAFGTVSSRAPLGPSIDASKGRRDAKIGARDLTAIQFGRYDIDLSALSQLVARSQLKAIGQALLHAKARHMDGRHSVAEILDAVEEDIASRGLDAIDRRPKGDYAQFRRFELAAALNRLRSLTVK